MFLITAGHNHGSGFIDLTNDYGNPVIGMLVDYQFSYNGGNAWYRFVEMDEGQNEIHFSTFSPYEASRTEEEKTGYFDLNFMTGSGNERTYDFDFADRFGFAINAISVSGPEKTVYRVGDELDLSGMTVTAPRARLHPHPHPLRGLGCRHEHGGRQDGDRFLRRQNRQVSPSL